MPVSIPPRHFALQDILGRATPNNDDNRLASRLFSYATETFRWDTFAMISLIVIAGIWLIACRWYLYDMICRLIGSFSNCWKINNPPSSQANHGSSLKLFREILSPTRAMDLASYLISTGRRPMQRGPSYQPETRDPVSLFQAVYHPDRWHHSICWFQARTVETAGLSGDPERATNDLIRRHNSRVCLARYTEFAWTTLAAAGCWRSEGPPPPYIRNEQGATDPHVQGDAVGSLRADVGGHSYQEHLPNLPPPTYLASSR
ncbi:hypothetical protein J3A83DRAFT_1686385 [Scleroderma citrinum]